MGQSFTRYSFLLIAILFVGCREHTDVTQANAAYDARLANEKKNGDVDEEGNVIVPGVAKVAVGNQFSCALNFGHISCWGANSLGQTGNGDNSITKLLTPYKINLEIATDISVGANHACAIVSKKLYCWGDNSSGQLGDGGGVASTDTPMLVTTLNKVTAVSAGSETTCAVSDGDLYCWGENSQGQLGTGNTVDFPYPIPVEGLLGTVTAVETNGSNTCAVVSGALFCWGDNSLGQIGNGTVTNYEDLPVSIISSGVTHVAVSREAQYACAIVTGALKCWGDNTNYVLGDGTLVAQRSPITTIASGVTGITAGQNPCAVVNGGIKCWGYGNPAGDQNADAKIPTDFYASGVESISKGDTHACMVTTKKDLMCWGYNSIQGALGINSQINLFAESPISVFIPR